MSSPSPPAQHPGATRRGLCLALCAWPAMALAQLGAGPASATAGDIAVVQAWQQRLAREVDHLLDVPLPEQARYLAALEHSLRLDPTVLPGAQCYVVVDRHAHVQAAFLVVRIAAGALHWLGATAVSTGKPGSYNHFVTPVGVFLHSPANPDYPAEGTRNKNGIRGYGKKGMRVFDLGWQQGWRAWGKGGESPMRLQMHATDADRLEPRLGSVQSEGCVRIPATLNRFLDHCGVLDAAYEEAVASGKAQWVLPADRSPLPWPGRYTVVVDSGAPERVVWSPLPLV
jgi:hypothetical protein